MIRKILRVLGIVVLILAAAAAVVYFVYLRPTPPPISPEDRAAINVMPLPARLTLGGGKLILDGQLEPLFKGPADPLVSRAFARFNARILSRAQLKSDKKIPVEISYDSASLEVQPPKVNEGYALTITDEGIVLTATTSYGILHGLETLSQLVVYGDQNYVPEAEIEDKPRFSWRGLMIDVGRHWIPKDVILRNLDAMAAVKLNVLHWHLSEYQGFRVESKKYPKLHELGSGGNYYSQDDIREVVAFAHDRGIRVVPEFDMPGHSSGFLIGYPELASAPGPYQLETAFGVFKPVMDPTRDEVYEFIDGFVGEMTALFPDSYFHIGGDEVDYSHWENSPSIQTFMKANEIPTPHALQAHFNKKVQQILSNHGRKMAGWDEILDPQLANDIVVQSWRTHRSLFEAVQQGNSAILSSGYYLDHKLPASKHYQVDPEQLPGAITIEPDSLHWQQYDVGIYASENPILSNMVLYGEGSDIRGLFIMMDNATAFEHAERKGDAMSFSFVSSFGEIDVESKFAGDSVNGTLSLGLLSFPFKGIRVGGNDMPGTIAPKVEKMKPLSDEDKTRILGGEAAMWTEVVSSQNIDSRIWPRTAAIAEKWWSPAELTKDINDMYRRLASLSSELDKRGLQHIRAQQQLVNDLAEGKDKQSLVVLFDVLEEVKYYERMGLGATTLTPMNEVVDAVLPESENGRRFTQMVDELLSDPKHLRHAEEIENQLVIWRNNHREFLQVATGNSRLEKVIPASEELSIMSGFALRALEGFSGNEFSAADKEAMLKKMTTASRAGVMLSVAPALTHLVEAMPVR